MVWEDLDRVLPERYAETGWGRRRLRSLADQDGGPPGDGVPPIHRGRGGRPRRGGHLRRRARRCKPWDPFAPDETERAVLPRAGLRGGDRNGISSEVRFRGVVLPSRDRFSSLEEFERLSGPLKWNRQQGLYIYRANRLVQHGGWSGLRGIDEHTKLARASIDFDTDLDEAFQINVAKMRVVLPPVLRQMLERPVHELCVLADDAYRRSANATGKSDVGIQTAKASDTALRDVGIALKAAHDRGPFAGGVPRRRLDLMRRRHPGPGEAAGSLTSLLSAGLYLHQLDSGHA